VCRWLPEFKGGDKDAGGDYHRSAPLLRGENGNDTWSD